MDTLETFPAWDKIVEYFENSSNELITKVSNNNKINYEELLSLETYQLWKLLNKM